MSSPRWIRALAGTLPDRFQSPAAAAILSTRLSVAAVALLIAPFGRALGDPLVVSLWIIAYVLLALTLVGVLSPLLERKSVRVLADFLDLLLISVIVALSGGLSSPWFVIFLFPVLSSSRYLGRVGSLALALFATLGYGSAALFQGSLPWASRFFWLWTIVLAGVALTAANLARSRDREEAVLLRALEEIDRRILADTDVGSVIDSILAKAMEITASDVSAIALVADDRIAEIRVLALPSLPGDAASAVRGLMAQHAPAALASRRFEVLPSGNPLLAAIALVLSPHEPANWGGRLVPLVIGNQTMGVLGVFSRRSFHYAADDDMTRLSSMAPLVAIVQKNATLYAELAAREDESRQRLETLYELGKKLKAEEGLDTLFQKVVREVSTRMASEEAALFIPSERSERIIKRAVWGPSPEITAKLEMIELGYDKRDNEALNRLPLTRQVFDTRRTISTLIDEKEKYAGEYGPALPSGATLHYIGVPLQIGSEVLGVIRVLNKKAKGYTIATPILSSAFADEDTALLETIATQVAAAIRNANFIEKNAYFQDLVYESPDPIIVLDKVGRIRHFNRQAEGLWGLKEAEVRHQSVATFYGSPEEAQRVSDKLSERGDHTIEDFPTEIYARGEIVPVRLSANLQLKDGEQTGGIMLFKDQRERIRQEEKRLRDEKLTAIGNLTHTSGHSIKNDLAAVLQMLEGLKREARGNAEILGTHAAILGAIAAAKNKVEDMLMAARTEKPHMSRVAFNDVLREFEVSVAHEVAVMGIKFASSYPAGDPIVYAEAAQLQQVLANLFRNSIDAIKKARKSDRPSAGKIGLTVEVHGGEIELSWHDDGIGLTAEAASNAFLPFYTTNTNGNGLGLFITSNIVINHGGTIVIEPTESVGAHFRIRLPVYAPLAT